MSESFCSTNEIGDKFWRNKAGQYHRIDGPAIERADGTRCWYRNRRFHRTDGPAIEFSNGSKFWYQNGKRHREDGPAVERSSGLKKWFQKGKLHREDGPAIEYAYGKKEFWIRGVKFYYFSNFLSHLTEEEKEIALFHIGCFGAT